MSHNVFSVYCAASQDFCGVSHRACDGTAAHLEQSKTLLQLLCAELISPRFVRTLREFFICHSRPRLYFAAAFHSCDAFFLILFLHVSVFSLSFPPLTDTHSLSLHHIELSVRVGPRVSWSLMDGEHVGGAAVLNGHGGLKRWGSKC